MSYIAIVERRRVVNVRISVDVPEVLPAAPVSGVVLTTRRTTWTDGLPGCKIHDGVWQRVGYGEDNQ